jgi:hypothetical protein
MNPELIKARARDIRAQPSRYINVFSSPVVFSLCSLVAVKIVVSSFTQRTSTVWLASGVIRDILAKALPFRIQELRSKEIDGFRLTMKIASRCTFFGLRREVPVISKCKIFPRRWKEIKPHYLRFASLKHLQIPVLQTK